MAVPQHEHDGVDVAELLGNVGDGVLAVSDGGLVSYANPAALRILGVGRRSLVGAPLPTGQAGPGDPVGEALRRVLRQRRPSTFLARLGHQPQWYEVRALPSPDGLVAYLRNVESEQRAEARRLELVARLHRSDEHAQQLLELTRALAGALRPTDVVETVTAHLRRSLGPALAGVWLLQGVTLRLVGASPVPPLGAPQWAPLSLAGSGPEVLAVRNRRATFRETPQAAAHLPLHAADGTPLGALAVSWQGPHPLSVSDRGFLGIVAGQAAQAIERALLLEQWESPADVLHRAALPTSLPPLPGWQLAGRYLPAAPSGAAGGEWYDAFTVPGGRVCLLVGNTSGHGLATARTATLLRAAARAYALLGEGPAGTLARLDGLLAGTEPDAIAGLTCLELDPVTGAGRWAVAGHPPPVLGRPGGWQLPPTGDGDPPLGCLTGAPPREHGIEVGPGETVLLLTRGLLRGPQPDRPEVGPSSIGMAIAAHPVGDGPDALEDLLDGVLGGILGDTQPPAAVCVLAARRAREVLDLLALERDGEADGPAELTDRHVSCSLRPLPQAAAEARRLTRSTLEGWGLHGLSDPATLVVSELVTNAVTHARSVLRLDLVDRGSTLRVSVTDASPHAPRRRDTGSGDERGRGVHLVDVLSSRWGTELLPSGKRVWAEIDADAASTGS